MLHDATEAAVLLDDESVRVAEAREPLRLLDRERNHRVRRLHLAPGLLREPLRPRIRTLGSPALR